MNICLSHTSALRFWRSPYAAALAGPRDPFYEADTPDRKPFTLPAPLPYNPDFDKLIGAERAQRATKGALPARTPQIGIGELSLLATIGGAYPCHAITQAGQRRSHSHWVTNHVCGSLPLEDAAVWLTEELGVVSPELLFVQMAAELPFVQLVELGFELCGYYAKPMNDGGDMRERRQLTTVAALTAFVQKASRVKGNKAALMALQYVLDGSASPMETKLVMLLTLPFARGGYNLPKPQMNGNVLLGSATPGDTRTCDLLWREGKLVVEYDGEEGHASHAQRTRGARRYEELSEAGYHCIVMTYGRLMDAADMDAVAAKIARHLGYRSRPRLADYPERKAALRTSLL